MKFSREAKAGLVLWICAELGAIAVSIQLLPLLVQGQPLPMPLWALTVAQSIQSGVFLALAVLAGSKLGPKVGLGAPILSKAEPVRAGLFTSAVVVAILGGLTLFFAAQFAPAELATVNQKLQVPILSRILYGGIAEEVLVRFGLMTFFAWLAWRITKRPGPPSRPFHGRADAFSRGRSFATGGRLLGRRVHRPASP